MGPQEAKKREVESADSPLNRRGFIRVSGLTVGAFTVVGVMGLAHAENDYCHSPWDYCYGEDECSSNN